MSEITFIISAITALLLTLVASIIYLVARCRNQFNEGVKWTEKNSAYQYTCRDMHTSFIQGSCTRGTIRELDNSFDGWIRDFNTDPSS